MARREKWLSANPLCKACDQAGRTAAAMHVDHVVPLADGGPDVEANMQSLCIPCHKMKTNRENARRAAG